MKKLLFAAVAVVALATPAMAFYTECTVTKEMSLASRPDGPPEPRLFVNKGDKVAYRQSYQGWWYVMHWNGLSGEAAHEDYGWLPQNVLTNCQRMEGTP